MNRIVLVVAAAVIGAGTGPLIRAQVCKALGDGRPDSSLVCPHCSLAAGRGPLWRLTAPVLWSGICARCAKRVGPPWGTVELLGAATLGLLAFTTDDVMPLIAYGWVAGFGLALAGVDIAVHRLPNRLTGLLFLGAALTLTLAAITSDTWQSLAEAAACSAAAGTFYAAMSVATRGGLGFGDAKLAAGLALATGWTGWTTAAFAITLGFVLTGLTAIALLLFTRANRMDSLPHGPFMVAATIAAIAFANL